MKTERITNQKEAVINYLKTRGSHSSAREIHANVKKMLPRISLATVYRIVSGLKEKNQIQSLAAREGRFDGNVSSHAHFVCDKCGRTADIFKACRECGILKKKKTKAGDINSYQIYFYGTCKKCKK